MTLVDAKGSWKFQRIDSMRMLSSP